MVGMLRVKNECRWIEDVIRSIQPLCEQIFVFDDHSTDETPQLCERLGATVIASPFPDGQTNESRDKEYLLRDCIVPANPDWVIAIDGDEILTDDSIHPILIAASKPNVARCSFSVRYLWDRMNQIRVDGVYGDYRRSSMFRVKGQPRLSFTSTSHGANFHCGNAPQGLRGIGLPIEATLLHLGYLHKEDRIRKYHWYRSKDPNSIAEDGYRHVVQGDLPEVPVELRLKHAGPLRLKELPALPLAA